MSTIGQFSTGIKSIQRGVITLTTVTSNTATITSVNTSKAVVLYGGTTIVNNEGSSITLAKVVLTNATTITVNRIGTSSTLVLAYQVIEYN